MNDASDIFRDLPFPGRRLISWSVIVLSVIVLIVATYPRSLTFNTELLPEWLDIFLRFCGVVALVLYFVGYWKAVIGKGYSRVLFIASFVPVIGLILIFFMPSLVPQQPDEISKK